MRALQPARIDARRAAEGALLLRVLHFVFELAARRDDCSQDQRQRAQERSKKNEYFSERQNCVDEGHGNMTGWRSGFAQELEEETGEGN
jgi:hypothetical protein